jgi:hypothetical protein
MPEVAAFQSMVRTTDGTGLSTLATDGEWGPATQQAAALTLGVKPTDLPPYAAKFASKPAPAKPKPAPKPAPKPKPAPRPAPAPKPSTGTQGAVTSLGRNAANTNKPAPATSSTSSDGSVPSLGRNAANNPPRKPPAPKPSTSSAADVTAARDLDAYATSGGADRAKVSAYQWAMGIDTDGTLGDATKARASQLLGKSVAWPSKAATGPVAPPGTSPTDAANRLVRYVKQYKGVRTTRIAAYQKAMGVSPASGTVGTLTKAKVKQLTGVVL